MFVNEDYINYKYVVSVSDNYVVLSKTRTVNADWNNPQTIDIIYQYLKPSTLTIEGERTFNSFQTFEQVDVTDNDFERADYIDIFNACMLFIGIIVYFVINSVTKLVHRGGAIYGN